MSDPSAASPASDAPAPVERTSMYVLDVGRALGPEYAPMLDDVLRMVCIQLTIQVMLFFSGDSERAFLTREFLLLVTYIELGVLLYWLVVRKLLRFV